MYEGYYLIQGQRKRVRVVNQFISANPMERPI
jgi:hypothetical protein